jgi:hypothetical protein
MEQLELLEELPEWNELNIKALRYAKAIGFTGPSRVNDADWYEFDIPQWFIELPAYKNKYHSGCEIRLGLAPNGMWCTSISWGMCHGTCHGHGDAYPCVYHEYIYTSQSEALWGAIREYLYVVESRFLKDENADNRKYGALLKKTLEQWLLMPPDLIKYERSMDEDD